MKRMLLVCLSSAILSAMETNGMSTSLIVDQYADELSQSHEESSESSLSSSQRRSSESLSLSRNSQQQSPNASLFLKLPVELQKKIWRRVVEFNFSNSLQDNFASVGLKQRNSVHCDKVIRENGFAFNEKNNQCALADIADQIIVYDTTTGKEAFKSTHKGVYPLLFSEAGDLYSGASDGQLRMWQAFPEYGAMKYKDISSKHSEAIRDLHDVGTGMIGSSSNDKTIILHATSGGISSALTGHTDNVVAITNNTISNHLVSVSTDKTMRFWDFGTNGTVRTIGLERVPLCMAITKDGYIVIGNDDGSLCIYDQRDDMHFITQGHKDGSKVRSVCAVGDDYVISGADDHKIILWRVSHGKMVKELTTSSAFGGMVLSGNVLGIAGDFKACFYNNVIPDVENFFAEDRDILCVDNTKQYQLEAGMIIYLCAKINDRLKANKKIKELSFKEFYYAKRLKLFPIIADKVLKIRSSDQKKKFFSKSAITQL